MDGENFMVLWCLIAFLWLVGVHHHEKLKDRVKALEAPKKEPREIVRLGPGIYRYGSSLATAPVDVFEVDSPVIPISMRDHGEQ